MTTATPSIAFHFNAPAKIAYACRLLRKAVGAGSTVAVLGDQELLRKLDEALWTFSALDFVPHQISRAEALADPATPVWLCETAEAGQGRQVLVNLTTEVPSSFDRFDRVIEVVTLDEADRQAARSRWKHYTERGYEIVRHDLKLGG
jgi:DNA polymerase III subunit chi